MSFISGLTKATSEADCLYHAGRDEFENERLDAALARFRTAAACFLALGPDVQTHLAAEFVRGQTCEGLRHSLEVMGATYSGVAGMLERRATSRPLCVDEITEAVRMRVLVWALHEDAVELGHVRQDVSDLDETRRVARLKLEALCEKDEVKDTLHGLLVARMERKHKAKPWLKREQLEEAPKG